MHGASELTRSRIINEVATDVRLRRRAEQLEAAPGLHSRCTPANDY